MDRYDNKSNVVTYWDRCVDINMNPIDKNNPPWTLKYDSNKGYYAISNHNYKKGIQIMIN